MAMARAFLVSPFGILLFCAVTTAACGGGSPATTGSVEGYLYVSTDCSSTAGPSYIITDSVVPPASYKALAETGVSTFLPAESRLAGSTTGTDGHFVIGSIPAGSHQVYCLPGGATQGSYFLPSFSVTVENGKVSKRFETSSAGSFIATWTYDCESRFGSPLLWIDGEPQPPPLPNALSHVVIEAQHSVECPIRAETDDFGHVAIENLQAGTYQMTIPLPACGIAMVCTLFFDGNGRMELPDCKQSTPAGAAQPPATLPSTGETP